MLPRKIARLVNIPGASPGAFDQAAQNVCPMFVPILVATRVSEWFFVHSLTLVATPTKPKQASRYRTQLK